MPYEYYAQVDESKYPNGAYDGDTIDFLIDCGFHNRRVERIRVLGIDTPELRGSEKPQGIEARDFTRNWLDAGRKQVGEGRWPFIITTKKADAFGRYLATIKRVGDGADLTQDLLDEGYPPYDG